MANELAKLNEIAAKLNEGIALGVEANKLQGFEKAFVLADAISQLQSLLTPEYMVPIMALQGNKLGFKTDKDSEKGYPESVVKNCVIEAVLTGVQVVGNQFNIIAGNCYITKEGFGFLLPNVQGLNYEIIPQLPRISPDQTSAAITMQIKWTYGNQPEQTREIPFPIKMNKYMGVDAIIGKATRKARAWLYNNVSGLEIADGDVQDVNATIMDSKLTEKEKPAAKEAYKTIGEIEEDLLRGAINKDQAAIEIAKLSK
jgi:hypothetical protein